MQKIVQYFIENPVLVNLGLAVIILTGMLSLSQIKTTNTPAAAIRSLSITVVYPGASPQEVEQGVVTKIEENLQGIQGIKRVTAEAQENRATINVQLSEGADPDETLNEVKNAVDKINSFPRGIEEPIVTKVEPKETVISMELVGNVPLSTLKGYAEQMKDDLIRYDGLSQVTLAGYPKEEIAISVRENALRAYQLTFDDVANAVQGANLEMTGGEVKTDAENIQIRARSKSYYAKDLKNIVVRASEDGQVVYLRDVATVRDRFADSPVIRRFRGQPSVLIEVRSLTEENILDIADIVYREVARFNEAHQDVSLVIVADQTVNILDTVQTMTSSVLLGLGLVLIVLGLFLERHLAFWVALKIPIALLGMFALAQFYGITINMVTLFGCILVLGILVDDGVVIAENIYQHFTEKKKSPYQAALDGTAEVMMPVLFSLMTTGVAFSLFFFLPGQTGDFFSTISFVVCTTLFVAMIESFFFLPAHLAHSRALRHDNKQSAIERAFDRGLVWTRERVYMPLARFALGKHNWTVLVAFGVVFAASLLVVTQGFVKITFFPNLNADIFSATLELKPGTNETITLRHLEDIEAAVWRTNEKLSQNRADGQEVIKHVEVSVGPESHQGQVRITMLGGEERGLKTSVVTDHVRQEAGTIPGAVSLTFGSESRLGGKPVSIALAGDNLEELRTAKAELKDVLLQRDDLKDVVDTDQTGLTEVVIALKPKAEYLGLTLQQVMNQVRSGFFGVEAQDLQRGNEEVKVWVRYGHEGRASLDDLRNMQIRAGNGQTYTLHDIADLEQESGVMAIHHFNGYREIRVEADLANDQVSALEVLDEVQKEAIPDILAKYPTVTQSLEGQNQESIEIIEAIAGVAPVVLLAMLSLIIISFKSGSQMLVVLMTLPFVLPGVVLGHYVHGVSMSIFSLIGMIALIGVVINDSLVLGSAFNQELLEGTDFFTALEKTTRSRFRPILLTTLTTVAGLAPMIAINSMTAAFLVPPAISIAYGLGVGLTIPLILLPTLLVMSSRLKLAWHRLWEGERAEREALEPAVRSLKHKIS